MIGNLNLDTPPVEQRAVGHLARFPRGTTPTLATIFGHPGVGGTACHGTVGCAALNPDGEWHAAAFFTRVSRQSRVRVGCDGESPARLADLVSVLAVRP
jgi:hypothetical protein